MDAIDLSANAYPCWASKAGALGLLQAHSSKPSATCNRAANASAIVQASSLVRQGALPRMSVTGKVNGIAVGISQQ